MKSTCAVVDAATLDILNIIVAAPTDRAYPGTRLVAVPTGLPVGMSWRYTNDLGFLSPKTQRFYTFAADGEATPVDTATAQAVCVQDVADEKAMRLAASSDAAYQAAVTANATALTTAIACYTFSDCVTFVTSGWPVP